MPKLTITIGPPGSGKSSWARAQAGAWLAGRDHARSLRNGEFPHGDRAAEAIVTTLQYTLIFELFAAGVEHVIVDETNLDPAHRAELEELAHGCGAQVDYADFRHVPIEECIARDALRPEGERVGEATIRAMAEKWGLA